MFDFEMIIGALLAVVLAALVMAWLSRAKPPQDQPKPPPAPKPYYGFGPTLPPRDEGGKPLPPYQSTINRDMRYAVEERSAPLLQTMVDRLVAAIGPDKAYAMLLMAMDALIWDPDADGWSPKSWAQVHLRQLGVLPPLPPPGGEE